MLEDKILMLRYNRGDPDALWQIYDRYKHDMVSLAAALLHNKTDAEDAVHDVFARLAAHESLKISHNLRSYLFSAVANSARQQFRNKQKTHVSLAVEAMSVPVPEHGPDPVIFGEQKQLLADALSQLPFEQREAVLLRHFADLKFNAIASMQNVSVNTVQARYRYGLDKLRSLLNGELL